MEHVCADPISALIQKKNLLSEIKVQKNVKNVECHQCALPLLPPLACHTHQKLLTPFIKKEVK